MRDQTPKLSRFQLAITQMSPNMICFTIFKLSINDTNHQVSISLSYIHHLTDMHRIDIFWENRHNTFVTAFWVCNDEIFVIADPEVRTDKEVHRLANARVS